jgi:sugar phosphate isomerase/epimerase
LGFGAVDYVSGFFQDKAGDFAWLRQLKRRAADAGVVNPLILVDGEGELASSDERARSRAVENHVKWLSAAAYLGCAFVRVNLLGDGAREEQARRAADSLQRLGEQAAAFGVDVLAENHGGLSSDGGWMAEVAKAAAHPRVGLLPDFGNFRLDDGSWYDRYRGVGEMLPHARIVCAKSRAFDAGGEESETDYARMLGIVRDAGFSGWIEIEYEGDGLSEVDGVKATLRLVERLAQELARPR